MLFHSPEFITLMLLTLLLFWLVPKSRTPLLAAANLLFYAASGLPYLALFVFVATATYGLSLLVQPGRPYPRLLLTAGVLLNLINLGIFKYAAFAAANLERLLHLGLDPKAFQLLLPVGISFYTFQMIAYLVDVYRGDLRPSRNLLEFWVFIAFFGQLIAGPIMRGRDFLPQIEAQGSIAPSWHRFRYGIFLFMIGLVKKVLLADNIGPLADRFFNQATGLGSLEAWIAAYLFAFQIYYDFSAYSDMAVGIGWLFGYELTDNFRTPYLAGNPSEFWRRWHITLSRWIRDYVYIPLGGSRRGELWAMGALLTAMALSGLWHGAAWTFVIWGIYHGTLSALHRLWSRYVVERAGVLRAVPAWALRWLSVLLMFQATTVGWVFFRAGSMTAALAMIRQMLTLDTINLTRSNGLYLALVLGLFLLHLGEFWLRHRQVDLHAAWTRWVPTPVRALAYTALALLVVILSNTKQATFIYFRF